MSSISKDASSKDPYDFSEAEKGFFDAFKHVLDEIDQLKKQQKENLKRLAQLEEIQNK